MITFNSRDIHENVFCITTTWCLRFGTLLFSSLDNTFPCTTIFNTIQSNFILLILNVCMCRLEGEGVFTDTQGVVWTGEFHGKAALNLKMQFNIRT